MGYIGILRKYLVDVGRLSSLVAITLECAWKNFSDEFVCLTPLLILKSYVSVCNFTTAVVSLYMFFSNNNLGLWAPGHNWMYLNAFSKCVNASAGGIRYSFALHISPLITLIWSFVLCTLLNSACFLSCFSSRSFLSSSLLSLWMFRIISEIKLLFDDVDLRKDG